MTACQQSVELLASGLFL